MEEVLYRRLLFRWPGDLTGETSRLAPGAANQTSRQARPYGGTRTIADLLVTWQPITPSLALNCCLKYSYCEAQDKIL
eukprot:scaffold225119_cov37-Prasinocladus_malaysianus.AAC.1